MYHFNSIKSYLNKYIIDVWLSATIKFLYMMVGNKYRVVRELPSVSFIKIYDVGMIVWHDDSQLDKRYLHVEDK